MTETIFTTDIMKYDPPRLDLAVILTSMTNMQHVLLLRQRKYDW